MHASDWQSDRPPAVPEGVQKSIWQFVMLGTPLARPVASGLGSLADKRP